MDYTSVVLTFSIMFSLLFFLVGGLMVLVAKDIFKRRIKISTHPEMYDENGNLIDNTLIAFNFDNYYDNEEEDY
ncbi:hypothetical protein [Synechococcus phage DSL-LC02]|nr:hypothetical protein [Synechococcus phage DSL-LC02]